jgi:Ca-activated chloride channel family protein
VPCADATGKISRSRHPWSKQMQHPSRSRWALALVSACLCAAISPAGAVVPKATPAADPQVALVAAAVGISAPDTVDPGQTVTVTVSGGRADGRLELWGPIAGSGPAGRVDSHPATEGTVAMTAPGEPGSYELRYFDGAGNLLARTSLDVASVPIVLTIPDPFGAGYANEVRWMGPSASGDTIQVFDPATGQVVAEAPAAGPAGAVNVAMVRAPERFGEFEVRYWSGASRAVLRSIPVSIGKGIAWLRSPVEVKADERFEVQWNGPVGPDDGFELLDPAAGAVLASVPAGGEGRDRSVMLAAPSQPGAYRVRYVNTATGYVFADLPLDVDPK